MNAGHTLPKAAQCLFRPPTPYPYLESDARLLFQPWQREMWAKTGPEASVFPQRKGWKHLDAPGLCPSDATTASLDVWALCAPWAGSTAPPVLQALLTQPPLGAEANANRWQPLLGGNHVPCGSPSTRRLTSTLSSHTGSHRKMAIPASTEQGPGGRKVLSTGPYLIPFFPQTMDMGSPHYRLGA